MILIDFDKLTELSNVLIQYKSVLQNNLDMAIKQGNNWTFSRQQFAKCPPLVQLEDDYRTLRKKREKILSDIDKTISCINYVISVYRGTEMAIAGLASQIIERNGLVTNTNKYLSMFKDIGECVADGVGGINEITDDIVEVIKEEDSDTDNTDDNTVLDNNENSTSLNGELFYNEFLAKRARDDYKADSKLYESNWDKLMDYWHNIINDKTPPLARLGIGEIPSSSDGIAYLLNDGEKFFNSSFNAFNGNQGSLTDTLMSSLFGTVLGSSGAYTKDIFGYLDENNIINLYPNSVKVAPFEGLAKKSGEISKILFGASAVFDLGNTWSAYSGNTIKKRLEKTGIQTIGDIASFGSGIVSGAVTGLGFALSETGYGALLIPAGPYIDFKAAEFINNKENEAYKYLKIK
jgi:hypothetical protein